MPRKQFLHGFDSIISLENLLSAWWEFRRDKRHRRDVQEFEWRLMGNLLELHDDLKTQHYQHSAYEAFNISDPKPRQIHKAQVRDRVLHHAIYRQLYPFFDRTFITDSYSCRLNKGTHKALERFQRFGYQAGRNHIRTVWVLKCDIRKFFASIDQEILLGILTTYIPNKKIIWLLDRIISGFSTQSGKGLPLGNLTSQLLVNIYMNEFDQYAKHSLKAKYYIRYADDFVILSPDKKWIENLVPKISKFLGKVLALEMHPNKVGIGSLSSGVDFLGWINFPRHRILRPATARRIRKRLIEHPALETRQSYLGLLGHGSTYKLREKLELHAGLI